MTKYSKVTFKDYSEKAIKFAMGIEYANNNTSIKTFFAPKSLLKDGCLPDWFLAKKFEEVNRGGVIRYETRALEDFEEEKAYLASYTHTDFMAAL